MFQGLPAVDPKHLSNKGSFFFRFCGERQTQDGPR